MQLKIANTNETKNLVAPLQISFEKEKKDVWSQSETVRWDGIFK